MTKNIDVKESIPDQGSDFNIKRFKIGGCDIERPTKIIDAKNITRKAFNDEEKSFDAAIFETSKLFSKSSVESLLTETDDSRIRSKFNGKKWISEHPHIISATFKFNPYNHYKSLDEIAGYFDYYYSYSNTALLVPNIKFEKYEYWTDDETEKQRSRKKILMDTDEYISFVEEAYEILDHKNNLPIFVPLSLRFDMSDIQKIAHKYMENDFFNIWIDFEGAITTTKAKSARIRNFLRNIEDLGRLDDVIIHSTNIKREIISNLLEEKSPSSDVLAPLLGANLIGVNRSPQRPINNPWKKMAKLPPNEQEKLKEQLKKEKIELKKHKTRVFDADTYYYYKLENTDYSPDMKEELMSKNRNILFNSKLLDGEFSSQLEHFLGDADQDIQNYIEEKPMMQQNQDLLKTLFYKEAKSRDITDWL